MFTAVSHLSLIHIDFLDPGGRQGKISITADLCFINRFNDSIIHFHRVGKSPVGGSLYCHLSESVLTVFIVRQKKEIVGRGLGR